MEAPNKALEADHNDGDSTQKQQEMLEELTNRKVGFDETVEYLMKNFPFFRILQTFEANQPYFFVLFGLFIYAMQMFAYVINPHFSDAWGSILGDDIATILYSFHFPLYDPVFNKNAQPLVIVAMMFALFAVGLIIYGSIGHSRFMTGDNEKQNPHFVYFNRGLLHATSTWMLVPSLQLCSVSLVCGFGEGDKRSLWMFPADEAAQCWGSVHLPSFIAASAFLVLVLPLLYLAVTCQFDFIRVEHPKCRRHTIVDEYVFAHIIFSSILFHILLGYDQRGAFAVLHCISSALVSVAHWYYLPYNSKTVNNFFVVVHAVEAIASAFLAAAMLNATFMASAAASPLLLGFAPMLVLAAVVAVKGRVNPIFQHRMDACHAEHALTEAPPQSNQEAPCVFPFGLHDDSKVASFVRIDQLVKECANRIVHFEQESDFQSVRSISPGHKSEVLAAYINTVRIPADVDTAASFVAHFVEELNENPTISMLQFAARIYTRGLVRFNSEPGLLCGFASFILKFVPPMSYFALQLIEESGAKSPSLQIRYRAHGLSLSLRVALGIKNQAHVIHSTAARQKHCNVLTHMNDFWLKLTEPSVNIGQISDVADEITRAREHAIVQFRRALQHQTSSDAVLIHRLGDFLQDVMLDNESASECYNEAKELREARQARSMRGTKQITAVETDLETLTERLLNLLQPSSRSDINGGGGSSSVVFLVLEVSLVYLVLLVLAILFVYVAVSQRTGANLSLDQIYGSGMLRATAPLFASTVQRALNNGTTFILNSSIQSPFFADLRAESILYSSLWSTVGAGSAKADQTKHINFMQGSFIPNYLPTLDNQESLSLWSLGQLFQSAADQMTSVAANITVPTVSRTTDLISTTVRAVSLGLDHYSHLYEKELEKAAEQWLIWVIILLAFGTVILASTYFAFLISLQRTALSRIFTFQLFTLIPFEALEKLAQETRQKMNIIQEEQKPKGSVDESHNAMVEQDEEDGSSRKKSASSSSIHSIAGAAAMAALKSCLKKPGQPKVHKKVVISNVIEILGGKDEVDKNAKKEAASLGAKAVSSANAEEDTERLLMKRPTSQLDPALQKSSKTSEAAGRERVLAVGGLCTTLLFLIVALIVLGTLLQNLSFAPKVFSEKSTVVADLDRMRSRSAATLDFLDLLFLRDIVPEDYMFAPTKLRTDFYNFLDVDMSTTDIEDLLAISKELQKVPGLMQQVLLIRSYVENVSFSFCGGCTRLLGSRTLQRFMDDLVQQNELIGIRARNRKNAINGTERDFYLIFGALVTDAIFNVREDVLLRLQDIRARHAASAADAVHLFYDNVNIKVALAVLCAGFCVAVALSFINVEEATSGFVSRPRIVLIALSFLVPLILVAFTASMSGSVHPSVVDMNNDLEKIASLQLEVDELSMTSRLFASANSVALFYAKDKTVTRVGIIPKLLAKVGVLTRNSNETWSRVQGAVSTMRQLTKISSALAINSISRSTFIEEPMRLALADAEWNFRLEHDYVTTQAYYPSTTNKYTNRSYDLQRPLAEQWRLGVATVTDDRFRHTMNLCKVGMSWIYDNVTVAQSNVVKEKMNSAYILTVISLATCALPLILVLLAMSKLVETLIVLLGLKNNTAGAAVENASYSDMVKKAQYGLALLFFLLCASFGIGVWQTTTAVKSVNQVNLATKRNFYVADSLHTINQLKSRSVARHNPSQLTEALAGIISTTTTLSFGPLGSQRYAMGRNPELDKITFGYSDSAGATSAFSATLPEDGCAVLPTVNLPPRGKFGSLVNVTIHQALQGWNRLLFEGAYIASEPVRNDEALESIIQRMYLLKAPLIASLVKATDLLMSTSKKEVDFSGSVLIAVAAIFIFAILVMYSAVFLPIVFKISEEGESAKLLLRMIPTDVRDKVPAIAEYIETGRIDNAAELQRKFEASERLLQNILPQKIASRLKSGEQPIADMHRCLTILFTDFVGFTKRSSNMQAAEIVDFLNEVFLEFDTVTDILELEKIKTIGDAYFMAGGLDPRMTDHAMRVIEAAYLFFESLSDYNIRHPNPNLLQMRLGIHTGPAVAGVIGTKKVAYDLWGESVEIANAMESTGVPGRIHISEDTAKQVEGFYRMEPRGELPREKEHIPDCMPATFLLTGRLLPTPYQHIQRPKMLRTSVKDKQQEKATEAKPSS